MPTPWRRLLAVCLCTSPLAAQSASPSEILRQYDEAVASAERGDLAHAVVLTDSLLQRDSTVLDAWWNLGIWRAALNQPVEALRAWRAYHALDSTDWRVEAKLVQSYQALQDLPRRDSALAGLLHHYEITRNPELKQAQVFCREQATVNGHPVMVFQSFAPKGERMVFVTFHLVRPEGGDTARYSLGSYDRTTAAARETGDIGPKDRLYHLDYYAGRNHATLAFYREMPSYDAIRSAVWAAIRGDLRPLSKTTVSPS